MTSEIRANTIKNRVGLGTIEYSNTGPVISGVTTASNFKTGTSNLHSTGLNIYDLDVDGHTNLDNVSVVGVTTITANNVIGLNVENSSGGGAQTTIRSKSIVANASNFVRSESSDNKYIGLLKYGTDHSAYGALAAGGGAVYANSSVPITIMSDGGYINFATGGNTERLRITSAGDVGINETSPLGTLHIKEGDSGLSAAGAHQDTVFIENSANAGITIATPNTNTGYLTFADPEDDNVGMIIYRHGGSNANSMGFFVNASERLRIVSNGNVEIGSAAGTGSNFSLLDGMVINTANGSAGLLINSSSSSHNAYLGFSYGSGSSTSHADQYSAYIGRVGDNTLILGTNNNIRATLTSDGDFIIGNTTTTDGAHFQHYQSSVRHQSFQSTNGDLAIVTDNNSNPAVYIKGTGTADLVNIFDNTTEVFTIKDGGNIGIGGNTNPTNVLHIKTAVNNTAVITLESTATDSYPFLRLKNDAREYQLTCHGVLSDAFTIYDGTASSHRFLITSGGQVVVGGTSSQASDAVTLMPDGEVTAAGFYFSNNIGSAMNNTGIRRATTNTMVFDTASTERLRIDADGNTSTKGSNLEHFVNKRVQAIAQNGNYVQYVLVAPTGTNNVRLQGKFHFTRASGTSGNAQQTVEAQLMTNNTGGDAQYYVRTASTDQGAYAGMYYRWVTITYNSTTYYALEGHPLSGSSYWGGFMQHGVFTGTANECSNLGTVLNTGSHSITNITPLITRKAHERWYNTNLNVQAGGLYVKQDSGLNGGFFAPTYYDVNGSALPTQMKVHGQKAVCIDCTRYYTSGDIITFRINNDYEGAIYVNPSGVQYNTTSDYRLKENVIDLTGAIDRVKQLKPKRFNFIKDPGNTMDGFMAHEVSSVVPNAVVGEKDAVKDILYEENDEDIPEGKKVGDIKEKDAIDPQSMDDSRLVPLLTAALQEAIAKIETLETKVAALEGS